MVLVEVTIKKGTDEGTWGGIGSWIFLYVVCKKEVNAKNYTSFSGSVGQTNVTFSSLPRDN
jgi:hypothetical protein